MYFWCRYFPSGMPGKQHKAMVKKLFLFVVVALTSFGIEAKVSKAEMKALVDIYESTNGIHWIRKWNFKDRVEDWHGVTVENGHVVELNLFRNNLMGPLPESIGNLKHLKVLNLAFNSITGELPDTVANLHNLEVFKIEMNRLKGELPSELGNLTNLQELTAFNNFMNGKIPASLGALSELRVLNLSSNQFHGEIPSELGQLAKLESLGLFQNSLYGEIPEEFGQLAMLEELVLSNNSLGGAIPASVGQMASLKVLQIQNNKFESFHGLEAMNENQFLVFDYDKPELIDPKRDFKELDFSKTRMADTKFEDEGVDIEE